ncbi:ATP-dependent protease ClpP protease subunit [Vogesella indigofera]|uniref:ATP-dependent Clp protease proteolytic subunit n=1 Tax=Vogesella indigofera TaxID=45465 RepID=A0A495BJ54_VOGIN|nr:head maturation protease, ClpP-related [Vogesella indigofera]RKQ61380.1 ATP-dependent protease ClpP protease subunit [Vogesella indigofera]
MNPATPRIFNGPAPEPAASGNWYRISNAANLAADQSLEVELYDDIGVWGIRAADFIRDLKAADDGQRPIVIAISSLGGDVFDGLAIHNTLRRLGNRVTARIDSVAASIASIIAVGAHRVVMPANSMMMIHNPWTFAMGEAEDLRATADMMDKVRDNLVGCYRAKAPALSADELVKMLDDTTWLTAQEALALGLVDEVTDLVPLKASANLRAGLGRLKNAPPALLQALDEPATPPADPAPAPAPDPAPLAAADPVAMAKLAARLCNEASLPAVAVDSVITVSALASDSAIRSAVAQATEIRDLCKTAKLPDLANSLIASGLDVESARARLFDKMVAGAGEELDNLPPADDPSTPKNKGPSARDIYASRRARAANPQRGNV